eukprot:8942554-Pyramimonas_sp.AAC.1
MTSAPPTKKLKLSDLGRRSHVTGAALSDILRDLQEHDLPEAYSTFSIRKARQDIVYQHTDFGPVIQPLQVHGVSDKSYIDAAGLWIQHPWAFLQAACKSSEHFRSLFVDMLNRNNNTVRLVMYSDEVTSGNVLSSHQFRRVEAFYWTFLEWGFPCLSHEDLWFTVLGARTTQVSKFAGGMSELLRYVLKYFLGAPSGHDMRSGLQFLVPGETHPRLIFGDLQMLVQDERAFKFSVHCKGSGAHRICSLCKNILGHKSSYLPDPSGHLKPATTLAISDIEFHDNQSVLSVQTYLRDIALGGDKSRLERVETMLGWNFSPNSVLQDEFLKI